MERDGKLLAASYWLLAIIDGSINKVSLLQMIESVTKVAKGDD